MKKLFGFLALPLLFGSMHVYAATAVELNNQAASFLATAKATNEGFKEISRSVDFNNTLHVRMIETYQGYPVFGGETIVHARNSNLQTPLSALSRSNATGKIYQNLAPDLANTPAFVFNQAQATKAINESTRLYREQNKVEGIHNEKSQLIVYVDKNNKAHWAYEISFDVPEVPGKKLPQKIIMIVDALTNQVYMQWDNLQTLDGGGNGGNKKIGEITYDGLKASKHFPKLAIERDPSSNTCFLRNSDVLVSDYYTGMVVTYRCDSLDTKHNNVYWDGETDARKGAYSPANDALFEGAVIKNMYQDWYQVPVLKTRDGKPMLLNMVVHVSWMDNAYWDGEKMTFGDGFLMFYPLTSLDVAAHEISHGFTEQHSNLTYTNQSGAMNESFSDMAAQAAQFYTTKKNDWKIGADIDWLGDALRYMDKPSKDCGWLTCSIDDASQYKEGMEVHSSSGVYNHFFYYLATTNGWDVERAFNVMVLANMNYWHPDTNFASGACDVLLATEDWKDFTKDPRYNVNDVKAAFDQVKIDTSQCKL